ncbi:MAG: GH3 auxin-responsive promoter family protein [Minwuia sp.]|nr:GH3 auxin-responsive promoter family protein [Minwuia sp.]
MKLHARRRLALLAAQDPVATQEAQLRSLLRKAAGTRFGRDHGFDRISTIAEFQARVPIRSYEDFWRDYWSGPFPDLTDQTWPGKTPYLGVSSGTTTGANKYLPITNDMMRSNKRAAIDIAVHHLAHHPESRLLRGKTFMLGGSTALRDQGQGVLSGDLSGIAVKDQSRWMRPFSFPPPDLALLEDWEEKLERLTHLSLKTRISMISGTPPWLLILFQRLHEMTDGAAPYPDLELLVHGGVAWDLYRDRMKPFLAQTRAATREVYPASEGFIAIADRGDAEGMRLILDNGIFFEFVPLSELGSKNPTRHWVGNVQTDIDYAIILSCNSGMFAYQIGDTVRFVDRSPPRLLITGRTSYMLSAFGEHLIGSELDSAVNRAAEVTGLSVNDYMVGAELPDSPRGVGHHLYLVETTGAPDDGQARRFADCVDAVLRDMNEDYLAHRINDTGMNPPVIRFLPPKSFDRWMAAQGKLGGQHKVPRVTNDAAKFATMVAEICKPGG